MIADLVRGDTVALDRAFLAAGLRNVGEAAAAAEILATIAATSPRVASEFAQLCDLLREHADLAGQLRLCADDPRHYIGLYEDGPIYGSLIGYSEERCAELELDIDAVLADARRAAEAIAGVDPVSVAA